MKPVSLKIYLLFMSMVFFITGTGLMIVLFINNINPLSRAMGMQSNPLFYLVMGFVLFCMFVTQRFNRMSLFFKIFCIIVSIFIVFCVYIFIFDYFGYLI